MSEEQAYTLKEIMAMVYEIVNNANNRKGDMRGELTEEEKEKIKSFKLKDTEELKNPTFLKDMADFHSQLYKNKKNYEYAGASHESKNKDISKKIDLQAYLENKLHDVISNWNEDDIYAISFFVYSNEAYEYNGYSNVTSFAVSYNTENDCNGADELSEERWNYAFWRQDETPIIDPDSENEGIKILFDWYKENGIVNIGYENYDDMQHIGNGPVGYYELLSEITDVAKRLQDSGFVKNKFGKPIPIIIHDLDYSLDLIEATKKANQNGEADVFIAAMEELGFC